MDTPSSVFTRKEWDSRKLSVYGYLSYLIDIFIIGIKLIIIFGIFFRIVPGTNDMGVLSVWLSIAVLLSINVLKKLVEMSDPKKIYQTIITKK